MERAGRSSDDCPSWVELPADVWQTILMHVTVSNALMTDNDCSLKRAMAELSKVCRKFSGIVSSSRFRRQAKQLMYRSGAGVRRCFI